MAPTFPPDFKEGRWSAGWSKGEGGDPLPSGTAGCLERDLSRWSRHQSAITSPLVTIANLYLWLHTDLVKFYSVGGQTLANQPFCLLLKERGNESTKGQVTKKEPPKVEKESPKPSKASMYTCS